ncbi:selenite/tellurite reduction operon c-type cytochrome ExtM [Desulfuromonas thiophila]|uniref:selenite/tellurite reduction operon c-type cytochrome ExtM n=1 Tax=Desulfuromonas thiophila TaxID=57664 RepID=UPI0029F52366|nr:selenite/tellurite reduction operon c-type cytochrome ExtM [Desulfuromonas thiophila]
MRFWSNSIGALFWALTLVGVLAGCHQLPASHCVACHVGLEPASASHTDCIACHGGDAREPDKKKAHGGMYGPRNPSAPPFWEKTCGRCHPYQLERMRGNLMFTNTGFIKNIQLTWEGQDGHLYGTQAQQLFDAAGEPLELKDVAQLNNLAGELYRKFCSLCHVGMESHEVWTGSHASGCAACHFPFNDNATYQGTDVAMRGRWPHSASHCMEPLPTNEVCLRCHNRSGRIALTYQGLNDGNNGLMPVSQAFPGPELISGVRNVTRIEADIHHQRGMDCIDCHTSRDLMGDGYAYENMYLQTEIACTDCHGSATERPRLAPSQREQTEARREARSYHSAPPLEAPAVLTAKQRPYSNVFFEQGQVIVLGKRDGQRHVSKVITGTPEHRIAGHERLSCYSCHSAAVPQCFGCHTEYDRSQPGQDFIRQRMTRGRFSETEDYRSLYPFALALDQRGQIAPVTPGCQTFVTVKGRRGQPETEEYVARFRDRQQLRFAPFYSHNTTGRTVGCRECHANPVFVGFGQHQVVAGRVEASLLCEKADDKPLDGFQQMTQNGIQAFSAIVREHSRPLQGEEIQRVFAVNQCLVCHESGKDVIYQQKLDYGRLLRSAGQRSDGGCEPR